jgi:hypothetical protein
MSLDIFPELLLVDLSPQIVANSKSELGLEECCKHVSHGKPMLQPRPLRWVELTERPLTAPGALPVSLTSGV